MSQNKNSKLNIKKCTCTKRNNPPPPKKPQLRTRSQYNVKISHIWSGWITGDQFAPPEGVSGWGLMIGRSPQSDTP